MNQVNQELVNQELGLHLRLTLIVPPSLPRPLPTEMEVILNLPSITTAAHMDQVLASVGKLLDSYAQAVTAQMKEADQRKRIR